MGGGVSECRLGVQQKMGSDSGLGVQGWQSKIRVGPEADCGDLSAGVTPQRRWENRREIARQIGQRS